jgi:hypothetical protein
MAKSAYNNIISSNKLKSQSAFIRSIQLIFAGPKESSLDLAAIRARKKSLSKYYNQIYVLGANKITLWAAAFVSTQWDPNFLIKPTFNYVIEFIMP